MPAFRSLAAAILAAFLVPAPPASAEWRDDIQSLKIGVLSEGDPDMRAQVMEPFRAWLAEWLRLPVQVVPLDSYAAIIDAQSGARVQYAIHSATSFATMAEQCQCVEAIGAPKSATGALGYHSVLVARADGPVRSLADARGKRIAVTAGDSVAGRLVPMTYFSAEGLDPDKDFAAVVEVDDPEAAIAALLAGEVDVAVAWSSMTGFAGAGYDFGVLRQMASEGRLSMGDVRVVWQSPVIPFGPHAVRSDLPEELKALITAALLSIGESPEALDAVDRSGYGGGGFASPDAALYAVARQLVAPSGPQN